MKTEKKDLKKIGAKLRGLKKEADQIARLEEETKFPKVLFDLKISTQNLEKYPSLKMSHLNSKEVAEIVDVLEKIHQARIDRFNKNSI